MATRDQVMKVFTRILTSTAPDEYYVAHAPEPGPGTRKLILKGPFYGSEILIIESRSGAPGSPVGLTLETGSPDFLTVRHDYPGASPGGEPSIEGHSTTRDFVPWIEIKNIIAVQGYKTPPGKAKVKAPRKASRKRS